MQSQRLSKVLRESFLAILYLISAQYLCAGFLTRWGVKISRDLPAALEQKSERPFAYRVLTPAILSLAVATIPREPVEGWLTKALDESSPRRILDDAVGRYGIDPVLGLEFLVLEIFLIGVAVGIAYAMRSLLSDVHLPNWTSSLMPCIMLIMLPLHFAGGGYVYDLPEVLLATLATKFFIGRRWCAYYLVLVLAVLNKESAVVLVGFCAAFVARRDMSAAWRHLLAHGLCMGPPFLATRIYAADNPGSHAMYFLQENIAYLLSSAPYLGRDRSISPFVPTPVSLNIVLVAVVAGLLLMGRRGKPVELRAMFFGVMVFVIPLYLVFGWRNEIRVFGMAFPIAGVLAAFALRDLFGSVATEDSGEQCRIKGARVM